MRPGNRQEQAAARAAQPRVRGRFVPGVSGNPSGRPKVVGEIRELARQHGPAAILKLVALSRSRDEMVALHACRALLDRGYGRPEQAIAVSAAAPFAGDPLVVTDPAEAARAYERVMRGDLAPEAVRFRPAALPAPAPGNEVQPP